MPHRLTFDILPGSLAVCRLPAQDCIPEWAKGAFLSMTRTPDELTIACTEDTVPEGIRCERGWRVLRVKGPLDFDLIGILASITVPLADAGVPVFAISTFDTDYVLVRQSTLDRAVLALQGAGHVICGFP